jgi:hypothetical protein
MKKQVLFIASLLFSGLAFSQIGIVDDQGNNVENTVIDVYLDADLEHIETDFKTQNLSSQTKTYNMKRYELEYIEGSQEYYCWTVCLAAVDAGTNYFSVFPSAPGYLILNAGADGPYSAPAFHFKPQGNTGTATYRYIIYDVNDENDSAYVDMVYHVNAVGINEYSNNAISNVYPNPANALIYIDINEATLNPRFEIYSLLGNRVIAEQISNQNGKVKIDVSNLQPGIYMLQELESQLTRKFIISR